MIYYGLTELGNDSIARYDVCPRCESIAMASHLLCRLDVAREFNAWLRFRLGITVPEHQCRISETYAPFRWAVHDLHWNMENAELLKNTFTVFNVVYGPKLVVFRVGLLAPWAPGDMRSRARRLTAEQLDEDPMSAVNSTFASPFDYELVKAARTDWLSRVPPSHDLICAKLRPRIRYS